MYNKKVFVGFVKVKFDQGFMLTNMFVLLYCQFALFMLHVLHAQMNKQVTKVI